MKRLGWAGVAVAMAILVAACGPVAPSPTAVPASPTPTATPSPAPARLTLMTEMTRFCGSIGGCAAYVALVPAGDDWARETRFNPWGERHEALILPATIDPGSYVARFRLVAVSDALPRRGDPFTEFTIATCEAPVDVVGQSAVEISVSFFPRSCTASVRYAGSVGTSA